MSIQAQIDRINTNIANAYTTINAKGGTIPPQANSANLASAIESISGGDINITNGQIQNLYTTEGTIEANTFISIKQSAPDISPGETATLAKVCRSSTSGSDVKIFHIRDNKYVIFNCGVPRGNSLNNNAVSASILTLEENDSIDNILFTQLLPSSTEYERSASWIYQLNELTFANFSGTGINGSSRSTRVFYDIFQINNELTQITTVKTAYYITHPSGSAVYGNSRGGFYLNGGGENWILYNFARSDLYLEAIKLTYDSTTNTLTRGTSKTFNDSNLPILLSAYLYGKGLPHQVISLSSTRIYLILQRSTDINLNQFSIIDINYDGSNFTTSLEGTFILNNTITQSRGVALFYYAVLGNIPYIIGAMAISDTVQEIGAYNLSTSSYSTLKNDEKYINVSGNMVGYETFIKIFDDQVLFIHPDQTAISTTTPFGLVGTLITQNDDGSLNYGSINETIVQTNYTVRNVITPTFLIKNNIGKSLFYAFNNDLKFQYIPLDLTPSSKIIPLQQDGVANGLTKTICSATTAGQVWIPIIS